ncbi:hypothetical protein, partial [Burkholderia gladioli]|uniref:hypothetical protein n=1 Tax=Burkholderia gladioli TaxID=28095 RepID=UPI001F3007EA
PARRRPAGRRRAASFAHHIASPGVDEQETIGRQGFENVNTTKHPGRARIDFMKSLHRQASGALLRATQV